MCHVTLPTGTRAILADIIRCGGKCGEPMASHLPSLRLAPHTHQVKTCSQQLLEDTLPFRVGWRKSMELGTLGRFGDVQRFCWIPRLQIANCSLQNSNLPGIVAQIISQFALFILQFSIVAGSPVFDAIYFSSGHFQGGARRSLRSERGGFVVARKHLITTNRPSPRYARPSLPGRIATEVRRASLRRDTGDMRGAQKNGTRRGSVACRIDRS